MQRLCSFLQQQEASFSGEKKKPLSTVHDPLSSSRRTDTAGARLIKSKVNLAAADPDNHHLPVAFKKRCKIQRMQHLVQNTNTQLKK